MKSIVFSIVTTTDCPAVYNRHDRTNKENIGFCGGGAPGGGGGGVWVRGGRAGGVFKDTTGQSLGCLPLESTRQGVCSAAW